MNIVELLRRDEGEILHAYTDHLGYWTLGVGRLVDKRKGGGISREESAYLLANDIKRIEAQLDESLPWWRTLSEPRQAVLVSMAFQMGLAGLLGFRNTLAAIKAGRYEDAAGGMLASKWATQTPQRAARLAKQMRNDVWV